MSQNTSAKRPSFVSISARLGLALTLPALALMLLIGMLSATPTTPAQAQGPGDGPGGVGRTDGTSSLGLWLKADAGVYSDGGCSTPASDGGAVGCWADQSGNGHDATAGVSPTFRSSRPAINSQPAVEFDGSDRLATGNMQLFAANNSGLTVFTVFDTDNNSGQKFLVNHSIQAGSQNFELGYDTGSGSGVGNFGLHQGSGDAAVAPANTIANDTFVIMSTAVLTVGTSPNNINIYKNGAALTVSDDGGGWLDAGAYRTDSSALDVGVRYDLSAGPGYNAYHDGDIAEIIVYTTTLTATARTHVDLYLMDKYDIDLNGTGLYGSGTYTQNVRGISRSASVTASGFSAGLGITDTAFLTDTDDVIVLGHSSGSNSQVTADLPAGVASRWERVWYVDINDAAGTAGTAGGAVQLAFDFSEAGLGGTPGGSYALLERSGTSGDFSVVTTTATLAGDQVIFTVDASDLNDGWYYTLGEAAPDLIITKFASPEPAVAGLPLTYTLVITNQGIISATNAILTDSLHLSTTLQIIGQTDDDDQDFDAGTYDNTRWHEPRTGYGWLEIEDTLLSTGVFTSRVFDASNVVSWTTLTWRPRRPYWKPLPDNGGAEWGYSFGEADMTGNRLLLHVDETAGATAFSDTSGQSNDGTCPAVAGESCPTAGADGRFNQALSFNGTLSQTLVVTDTSDPVRYALEMWVYPTVVTDTSFVLRTDTPTDTAVNYSHILGIVDDRFAHIVYDGAYHTITAPMAINTDEWYHLVGTAQSGGDMELYVNGVRVAQMPDLGTLWTGGEWYRLGSSYGPTGTTQYFSGRLDEVAVYSRTLSSGEVRDHYLRGALRLGFQVRSCDDGACDTETFSAETYSEQSSTRLNWPSATLSGIPDNRYFQYRATLETDDADYSPELRSVTVGPDHYAVYADQGSCAAVSTAFTCTLGSLAANETLTVTAYVNLHPSALGSITNTAAVTTSLDISPTDNSTFVTSTVSSQADVRISKYDDEYGYDGTDPVNPGSPMTYTLIVHNAGPSTAWTVQVTDTLPITVTGVSAPSGWDPCQFTTNTITCTVGSLLPHTWPRIVVTGTAPTAVGIITNTAWVTASNEISAVNNSGSETTSVEPLADLSIEKMASPDPVNPGEILTFTITVTNAGPSPATDLIVTDTLQTGFAANPVGGNWSCGNVSANVVTCTLASLASGAADSFFITTTAPLSGTVANQALVTSVRTDPDEEDNLVYAYAAVLPVANLSISKQDTLDPVDAGTPLTYTLTITNAGYVAAGAVESRLALTNARNIHIPNGGRASPYPSALYLSGAAGTVRDITVTLNSLSHTYPADLEVLLVGPSGANAVIMANAGGGASVSGLTLTFHDTGISMPVSDTLTSTVTYRPTNHGLTGDLADPAPDGPYGGSLSVFSNASPNGLWRLYVYDTFGSDGGDIAGGWSLYITTLTTDTVTVSDTLPSGLAGPNVIPSSADWTCDIAGDSVTCDADTFAVGVPTVFTITATAPITAGVITNTASITSTTVDLEPETNVDEITTTIKSTADLAIAKAIQPDPVEAGTPLTYTLTISNLGPSPLQATIVVTDRLPGVVTNVGAPGCDISALPLVTCTLNSLAVGEASDILITATAPTTVGLVLTNTAGVTVSVASDPQPLNNSTLLTATVEEQPIAGLQAVNDSPTEIGNTTNLWATVTAGSNITYEWNFGDGVTDTGNPVAHTYGLTGTYTAIVTATNSVNSQMATTQVSITEVITHYLYLPLIMRNHVFAPDLVVDSIIVTSNNVQVVVLNQGATPVEDEFWVDAYIDPDPVPTAVNQIWEDLCDQGIVWGVTVDALPLQAGDVLTLTVGDDYYWPDHSDVHWPLPSGTEVWAQADSAHAGTSYGGVFENHEIVGGPYNNVSGPVAVTGVADVGLLPAEGRSRPVSTNTLPPRR